MKIAQAQLDEVPLESETNDTRVVGAVGPPMGPRVRGTSEELLQAVLARLDRLENSLKPRDQRGQQNREANGVGPNPDVNGGSQSGKIICRKWPLCPRV